MLPFISIFGFLLPAYGLLLTASCALSCCLVIKKAKKMGLDVNDTILFLVYAAGMGFVFSKLLYIATIIPELLAAGPGWLVLLKNSIIGGGLVFYGGVIGAPLGAALCQWIHKIKAKDYLWIVWILPLAHAVGRIGCFMAGCCHGMESSAFGIAFHDSPVAQNGIPFIPVQLIEAAAEIVIFFKLNSMLNKKVPLQSLIITYLLAYAVCRFILEFIRGDLNRGILFGFATSQWISLTLIVSVTLFVIVKRIKSGTTPNNSPTIK